MRERPINNLSKVDIVDNYLEGDLEVFLKRVTKSKFYALTYSVTLKKWRKESKELYNYIKKRKVYPGLMNDICNIHKVMVEYYGSDITVQSFKLTERIEDVLSNDISGYSYRYYKERAAKKIKMVRKHTKKELIRECKRRGFIPLIDFEDYDVDMGHIGTIDKVKGKRLYYPANFKTTQYLTNDPSDIDKPSVNMAQSFVGIHGFTRIFTKDDK